MKPEVKISYYPTGQLWRKVYWLNNRRHNKNGPAVQFWYLTGQKHIEEYWLNGHLHNENGPARQCWTRDGQIYCEEYWLDSKQVTKEQVMTTVKIKNFLYET